MGAFSVTTVRSTVNRNAGNIPSTARLANVTFSNPPNLDVLRSARRTSKFIPRSRSQVEEDVPREKVEGNKEQTSAFEPCNANPRSARTTTFGNARIFYYQPDAPVSEMLNIGTEEYK